MSNWDDEDWDDSEVTAQPSNAPAPVGDWDDEDVEEEPKVALKKPSAPMRPKKALELALKAKEDAEREKQRIAIETREKQLAEMSLAERKAHEQEIIENADLENTKDLFDGGGFKAGRSQINGNEHEQTLDSFQPKTDKELETFANMLGKKICPFNSNPRRAGRYIQFLKHTFRAVVKDLNADDINELSTFLGVLSNEKRDEQKRSKGIKKRTNKKSHVKVDRADDLRSDRYDDFADDFM